MSVNKKRNQFVILNLFTILSCGLACSTANTNPREPASSSKEEIVKSPEQDAKNAEVAESHRLLSELSSKIQTLEARLIGMNDKLDATRQNLEKMIRQEKEKATEVLDHPARGVAVTENLDSPQDPETGFANDSSIQDFRKALILFKSQKYPESVLAFSEFLDRAPDHPLAGSAQYYVGEAYLKQKEYRLALQEYQRVLTSYDRSPHIADTLASIVLAEEALKKAPEAAKHRQLLTSLFPLSPAIQSLRPTAISEPVNPEKDGKLDSEASSTEKKVEPKTEAILNPAEMKSLSPANDPTQGVSKNGVISLTTVNTVPTAPIAIPLEEKTKGNPPSVTEPVATP